MKISSLPAEFNDFKSILSGICNEATTLLEQRKNNNDTMQSNRDEYTSIISGKSKLHRSIRNYNTTIVDNYFTNLINTYFITDNPSATIDYIRSSDNIGLSSLRYKLSINFILWIYKVYLTQPTSSTILDDIANYYKNFILNDLTYQFELLDFYPEPKSGITNPYPSREIGKYSDTFYTLSDEDYKKINNITKYTYMLSGYNNNIIPTSSEVISSMSNYNSLSTNYPTNLELDIKNKLNLKRNELNGLINKLRYENAYNYKEILTIKKLISAEFTAFKSEALNYNTKLSSHIGSVYMTLLHMQYLMTWLDYQLNPNEITVWRIDVVDKAENYITKVYPSATLDPSGNYSYGDYFNNKANFSLIFNM